MKLKAVLLDLDNTLYAYDPPDRAAMRVAASLLGRRLRLSDRKLAALYRESHKHFARALAHQSGRHNRLLIFSRMIERVLHRPQPALALRVHDAYWKKFLSVMKPHPEAHDVLLRLAARYKLALVTNQTTEAQYRKVERLGFGKYFSAVITSEQAGVEKPDGGIFRVALEALGVGAAQAVMVGDTVKGDVAGAQGSAICAVQTLEFVREKHATIRPDHTVRRLGDVPGLLESLGGRGF